MLKKALPQLAPLVHDSAPKVRLALAELLASIGGSRELHWWDVVPQVRAGAGGWGGGVHSGDGLMTRDLSQLTRGG